MARGEDLELNASQDEIRIFLIWLWFLGFLADIIAERNVENCFSASFESRGEECHETGLRLSRICDYGLSRTLYNLGIERGTTVYRGYRIIWGSNVDRVRIPQRNHDLDELMTNWRTWSVTNHLLNQIYVFLGYARVFPDTSVWNVLCVNNSSGKQQNKHPQF